MRELFLDQDEIEFILLSIIREKPAVIDCLYKTSNAEMYEKAKRRNEMLNDLKEKLEAK